MKKIYEHIKENYPLIYALFGSAFSVFIFFLESQQTNEKNFVYLIFAIILIIIGVVWKIFNIIINNIIKKLENKKEN